MALNKERRKQWTRQWYEKTKHPCPDCGQLIYRYSYRCRSCAGKAKWLTGKYDGMNRGGPKGEKSWNWKGGRTTYSGYIYIKMPQHPRAHKNGYVAEHILVWEEAHNQPLPDGWIVHHLNGIKDDNRPKNLEAMQKGKHYLILPAMRKRIQELEALLNNQHQLL